MARADANAAVVQRWIDRNAFASNLAKVAATRSNTSVCLTLAADESVPKKMVKLLEAEKAAYDIGSYRDAPPGLRIWCGATVETSDLEALMPWLDWAYATATARIIPPSHLRQSGGPHGSPRSRFRQAFETAVQIFRDRGVEVDYLPDLGKDKDALLAAIPNYDGLAIRSATKVTPKIIAAATRLKVIGRAGIGVDNVDIPAATQRGIVVMNTPFGNAITTAEHAISMMMALARQIPEANASTHAGKWGEEPLHGVSSSSTRHWASSAAATSARSWPTVRWGSR